MFVVGILIAAVSLLYGTAGQAGGSGFVAVMTFTSFPLQSIRATALALNVVAAAYASLQFHRAGMIDRPLLGRVLWPSVPAAFAGGLISLGGAVYSGVTGALLLVAAVLMAARKSSPDAQERPHGPIWLAGAASGLASGVTGVGGGVFLSSLLILFAGISPKRTAALSPPYILANSLAALAGLLIAGQRVPLTALPLAGLALLGSAAGTAIGLRWMSERAIRAILAAILLVAAAQLLMRAL